MFVIGGMPGKLEDRPGFAAKWLKACAKSGQPSDPRTLLEDPPASLDPAGLAVKAVAEQADPARYLRRLREAIFLEGAKADRGDALFGFAREVGNLDLDRLHIAFGSNGTVEAFAADRERAEGVELPSLSVEGGEPISEPERWREAVLAAGAEAKPLPGIEEALRHYGTMTTPEVAAVCDLPGPRGPAELFRLALEFRVSARRVLGGELWSAA